MTELDLSDDSRAAGGSKNLGGYLARPDGPGPFPAVVMIHEAFGLNDQTRRHADRLAEAGYLTLAVDLFSDGGPRRCLVSTMRSMMSGEGYTKTFKELMETTDWDTYGTGKYEKCADCMAHCGYEPTAANAALSNPLKAMWVALRGVRTTGPMAPEINLDNQRPAQYIFSSEVQKRLSEIRKDEAAAAATKQQQKASTAA